MASQSKRAQSSASGDADEVSGLTGAAAGTVAEVSRQQLAATAEAFSVFFRATESIQQAQLQMGQRAALLHSQAAENIRKATSPLELASIQSTLVIYQMQEAMRYWQELVAATAKASGELMRPGQAQQEAGGGTANAATSVMGAAMNAAGPMADAFQQMFTAPLKAAAAQQQAH